MMLRGWSNLRLRTKGLFVVAFPAAATVAIACAAYHLGSLAENAQSQVNRTFELREAIEKLKASEFEVSAVARGYFITQDEAYADGMRAALASFDAGQQKLADLTAGNLPQARRLEQIEGIQRSRVERNISAIVRLRAGVLPQPELAAALRDLEEDRLNMEKLIEAMLEDEGRLLETCLARARALRFRTRAVIGTCGVLGVAGGLVISLLFASGITSRIGKLTQNVAKLATGGLIDAWPTGRDEIGRLNESIARTSEILRQKTDALDNAPHGIAQADASGRYVSFNQACGELLGLSEAAGPSDVFSSVCAGYKPAVEEAVARMRAEGRGETEARIPRTDGSVTDVAMILLPVTSDRAGGYHIFVRDIGLQKEAEAALIRAKDAAVASNRARTEFLAKISHDIRTPLNAILGSADLLSQTPLNHDQREYVSMFQRNSRQLVALINDFLDFSRIEAGAVRLERVAFRVRQIVDDAVRTFHESAARKRVALTVEIQPSLPDSLIGDPLRIQQVASNLLSNALKFTSEGRVMVRVVVSGPDLRFEVADTGPGIAASEQEKIFAPFTQLPNQGAASIQGAGLGLTICRELVQLMGGEIGLESQEGVGSVFFFTVPLECAQPNDPVSTSTTTAQSPGKLQSAAPLRILVAEDSEDNRALLRYYLRDHALAIEFVRNGHEAVAAALRPGDFDLILMDIDMPCLDGRSATRKIRNWETTSGRTPTPIVALSAHAIQEEVRACLTAGCVAHIAKPVDQTTLLEAIQRYARTHRPLKPAKRPQLSQEVAALVPGFLAAKPFQIGEALGHLGARDFEPIRLFGHNLKGTARGYGFPEMEELGNNLEQSAKDADESSIAHQLLALQRAVNEASALLTLNEA